MKKKIALLLSALMIVGMIPANAFAITNNSVSPVVTGGEDDEYTANGGTFGGVATSKAPVFKITEKDLTDLCKKEIDSVGGAKGTTDVTFKATLTNAEFKFYNGTTEIEVGDIPTFATFGGSYTPATVQMISSNSAIITAKAEIPAGESEAVIKFPIESVLKTNGEATITIDPLESDISSGTYKFANVVDGATTTTIEKTTDISEDGAKIKPIVITETSKGSMKWGTAIGGIGADAAHSRGELKFKLTNGFTFDHGTGKAPIVTVHAGNGTVTALPATYSTDDQEMYIKLTNFNTATTAMIISISNVFVEYDDEDVKAGDVASITVSGYDMSKATVEVAVARTFGVSFTAENKTLPVFYSGRKDADLDSLKVTMKETILHSWLENRKTTITFPKGVKIIDVDVSKKEGFTSAAYNIENNELTITNVTGKLPTTTTKAKIEMNFTLSISPDFTGDITAVLGGSAIEEDIEAVVGTAVAPIKVEAATNPVSIDYRNVAIGDIVITEAYAGALEKDKTLSLEIEKGDVKFDGTPTVEVVEGDIKIEDVDTNGGTLTIEVKTSSSKTPAVLKVTGVKLYLDRSIPAGGYALKLVANSTFDNSTSTNTSTAGGTVNADPQYVAYSGTPSVGSKCSDAFFQNSVEKNGTYKKTTLFDVRDITVVKDFVNVVTGGRDQGETFTTSIAVTIGADKLIAGEKEITLDVPAYIANGYTMLPVRAITEALSSVAVVRWDDATHTVTITFGSRIISMTVGSKTMNVNGVPVPMQSACEITDSRAFIPLRDLGNALGLNDSKINWDDATKTAKLN